eukprot:Tbor_TRINITY_DN5721_c2_g2::TRINITY_DN5721_c2_g2_i15::g.20773::m.20773
MRRFSTSYILCLSTKMKHEMKIKQKQNHSTLNVTPEEIARYFRQDPTFALSLSKELSSTHILKPLSYNEGEEQNNNNNNYFYNNNNNNNNNTQPNSTVSHPSVPPPLTATQITSLAIRCGLPFFAFGLCDNLIMISVGDIIDSAFGVTMGFSTMVAAGAGQAVSDGCGVTIQQIFENFADKIGLPNPELTAEQEELSLNKNLMQLFRTIGIVFGCLIGLIPVIIFDTGNRPRLGEEMLKTLPVEQRNILRSKGVNCTYKKGDYLLRQGEEAPAIYTVLTGELKIIGRDDYGELIEIARHYPGDITGGMEIVFGHKCVADVIVASNKVKVVRILREDIEAVDGALVAMRRIFKEYIESNDDYILYRSRHHGDIGGKACDEEKGMAKESS